MSARMEKVREALTYWSTETRYGRDHAAAALAEVEEWETRLAQFDLVVAANQLLTTNANARAEAAEEKAKQNACDWADMKDERDRLKAALAEITSAYEASVVNQTRLEAAEAERDRLRDALEQIAARGMGTTTMSGEVRAQARYVAYVGDIARAALGEQT